MLGEAAAGRHEATGSMVRNRSSWPFLTCFKMFFCKALLLSSIKCSIYRRCLKKGAQDASTLEDWTVAFNIRVLIPAPRSEFQALFARGRDPAAAHKALLPPPGASIRTSSWQKRLRMASKMAPGGSAARAEEPSWYAGCCSSWPSARPSSRPPCWPCSRSAHSLARRSLRRR